MNSLRAKIFDVVRDDDNAKSTNWFDWLIIILILLTVVSLILDSFDMPDWFFVISRWFEVISVGIFTIEYLLRVWTAPYLYPQISPIKARVRYIFSVMALIDLIAILPVYIPFIIPVDLRALRVVRVFRLLRVFKINRYTNAFGIITEVFKRKVSQLISSISAIAVLLIVASILMYNVEHVAQPGVFKNALSGLWWATSIVTGFGFGDIYPVTILGRVLTFVISFLGIGLIAVPTGILSAGFVEIYQEDAATEKGNPRGLSGEEITFVQELLESSEITSAQYEHIVGTKEEP